VGRVYKHFKLLGASTILILWFGLGFAATTSIDTIRIIGSVKIYIDITRVITSCGMFHLTTT